MNSATVTYLDHAAATPVADFVEDAMRPYLRDYFYNPSAAYAPAVQVRRDMEAARHRIAVAFGGKADDCIMTAGATESINLAMTATGDDGHVVYASIEHDAVRRAAESYSHTIVPVQPNGIVSPQDVAAAITDKTQVVSVALANHELGTVQSLKHIADEVHRIRRERQMTGDTRPLWLHTDASQGVCQMDISVARLGVDMMTLNAGKIYGPKQVGVLWRRPGVLLRPIVRGGGQEMAVRSGTENVAGCIGMAAALEHAQRHSSAERTRLSEIKRDMVAYLRQELPTAEFFGAGKRQLPGHIHMSIAGIDAERIIFQLETKGILLATGSACAANAATRSHVLEALGMSDSAIDGSFRITLGRLTTSENARYAAKEIASCIQAEMKRVGI